MRMFVLVHVTLLLYFHIPKPSSRHTPINPYPENPYKPQKSPQKNIVKNPPNPEIEPIQIVKGLS
jgi:hypothetical protein